MKKKQVLKHFPYIKNLIKKSELVELTGEQMELITEGKCRVIAYEELEKCQSIDACFQGKEGIIMLYQKTNNNGHWCLLFKENANTLNFFDPYAFQMDEELKFSDYNLQLHNGEQVGHLTALIEKSNFFAVVFSSPGASLTVHFAIYVPG